MVTPERQRVVNSRYLCEGGSELISSGEQVGDGYYASLEERIFPQS